MVFVTEVAVHDLGKIVEGAWESDAQTEANFSPTS